MALEEIKHKTVSQVILSGEVGCIGDDQQFCIGNHPVHIYGLLKFDAPVSISHEN